MQSETFGNVSIELNLKTRWLQFVPPAVTLRTSALSCRVYSSFSHDAHNELQPLHLVTLACGSP